MSKTERKVSLSPLAEKPTNDDVDDVIVLDEADDEESNNPSQNSNSASSGPKELCTFQRETITEHDYRTLADEEYLNDNIINFYLTFLHEQLPADVKNLIHIYSSHFYSRLKGGQKKQDKDKTKTRGELCYERVKSWTRKIDIFSKRMLIFPICDEEHWFVIIVCNPGLVLSQKRQADFENARRQQRKLENKGVNPFFLVLDSLSATHSTALNKIRTYLQFEHLERKKYPLTFGKDKMDEKNPEIPLQPNSCDCGLFLLHYVELIFQNPAKFLGADLPDLSSWFSEKEIDYKRHDIARIIKYLALNQSNEKVRFPKIKFPAKRDKKERIVSSDPRLRKHGHFQKKVPSIPALPEYNEPPPPEAGIVKGGPPRTPPYPPPETQYSPSPEKKRRRRSSGNILSQFPSFIRSPLEGKTCKVVATRLDEASMENRKFFKHRRDQRRSNKQSKNVINSKSEMFEELMKGCE